MEFSVLPGKYDMEIPIITEISIKNLVKSQYMSVKKCLNSPGEVCRGVHLFNKVFHKYIVYNTYMKRIIIHNK